MFKNAAFDTRTLIALALVAGFMAAYFRDANPSEIMRGALISAFAAAYGYYLGSSKGSTDKSAAMALQADPQPPAATKPGGK